MFALQGINAMFSKLHAAGLWLTAEEHSEVRELSRDFCVAYAQLAAMSTGARKLRFKLRPKLHMFYEAICQNSGTHWALNPINACCWSDEDFIGKCSRVSRSCYGLGLSQSIRCLQKVLGEYKAQFKRI